MNRPHPDGTFVISSGRAGSTMLSRMLAMNPSILSVQELIGFMSPAGLGVRMMSGQEFWELLVKPSALLKLLISINRCPREILYAGKIHFPCDEHAAFPALLAVALPALFNEPAEAFQALASRIPSFPQQSLPAHYRAMFELLMAMKGKESWVERSGTSSLFAIDLIHMFPQAKFIYLRRNYFETALSMSRHPVFQLMSIIRQFRLKYGYNFLSGDRPPQSIPRDLVPLLPKNLTGALLESAGKSVEQHLLTWLIMSDVAEAALAGLPDQKVLRLSYEDLIANPHGQLCRVGQFLRLDEIETWVEEAARIVKPPADQPALDSSLLEGIGNVYGAMADEARNIASNLVKGALSRYPSKSQGPSVVPA